MYIFLEELDASSIEINIEIMAIFSVITVACAHFVKIELEAVCVNIPNEKFSIT